IRKGVVSIVFHNSLGSFAARARGEYANDATMATRKAKRRNKPRQSSSGGSEVVVKERLSVAHVAVHQLPGLGGDLGELGAKARRGGVSSVARLPAPPDHGIGLELVATGERDTKSHAVADLGEFVRGDEEAPVLDDVVSR